MSTLDELISQLPIGAIAAKLGVDADTAESAVKQALPALVGGLEANASQGGAESIAKAVAKHGSSLVDGGVNLDDVDTDDGEKIVNHVFGDKKQDVVAALGNTQPAAAAGGINGGDLIAKLLPILAPIVMSYLAKQFQGKQSPAAEGAAAQPAGGGLGDILGGLLGGLAGGQGASQPAAGGGLGDILGSLGGLLGGGTKR